MSSFWNIDSPYRTEYFTSNITTKPDGTNTHHIVFKSPDDAYRWFRDDSNVVSLQHLTVDAVMYAIEHDIEVVDTLKILFEDGSTGIQMTIRKSQWRSHLDRCFETAMEMEAYEICSRITKVRDFFDYSDDTGETDGRR